MTCAQLHEQLEAIRRKISELQGDRGEAKFLVKLALTIVINNLAKQKYALLKKAEELGSPPRT